MLMWRQRVNLFTLPVPCGIARHNTGSGDAKKEGKVGNSLKVTSNCKRKTFKNMAGVGTTLATIDTLLTNRLNCKGSKSKSHRLSQYRRM